MNRMDCAEIRDLLPELLQDALEPREADGIRAHLDGCAECRAEAELLQVVLGARPEPPVGLEARIQASLGRELARRDTAAETGRGRGWGRVVPLFGGRFPIPAAALPAAAVLVIALGTGVLMNRMGTESPVVEQEPIQVVLADEPLPEAYLWDDGVVAGAPVFEGLSDEELETLLAELEGEA